MTKDYFSGELLWGDDFSIEEIKEWYKSEEEAFADLYGKKVNTESYEYHNLNNFYGYRYLSGQKQFDCVLGLGASWGFEYLPIADKIKRLIILESSSQTRSSYLKELIPEYSSPNVDGKIDFGNNTFDLITCFDTLHHIPNVTFVLNELFRVLKPGGHLLLREPIHSMGDWRYPRKGLTTNERGIPKDYLFNIIKNNGAQIIKQHYYSCMTSYFKRKGFKRSSSKIYLFIDKYLSKLFSYNIHYHPTNKWQRIAPSSIFLVLKKK